MTTAYYKATVQQPLETHRMLERILWGAAGIASTGVGLLGLIIPIIPGILFLLLAAVCFSRAVKPKPNNRYGAAGRLSQRSFADEMRADLHQQYRSFARQLARQQRRFRRR